MTWPTAGWYRSVSWALIAEWASEASGLAAAHKVLNETTFTVTNLEPLHVPEQGWMSGKCHCWFLVCLFLQQTIFYIVANWPQVGVNKKKKHYVQFMTREQNKDKIKYINTGMNFTWRTETKEHAAVCKKYSSCQFLRPAMWEQTLQELVNFALQLQICFNCNPLTPKNISWFNVWNQWRKEGERKVPTGM